MDYLGIDFGTTNTLAGVIDFNKKLQLVPLEGDSPEMPSAIFLKIRHEQLLALNQEVFERRFQEAKLQDKKRFQDAHSSLAQLLKGFRIANKPRLKEPKPFNFSNSEAYNKALNLYLRDKRGFDKILQHFENTKVKEEEERLTKLIQPLKDFDSIKKEVTAKMEQELMNNQLDFVQSQTFFTALDDPNAIRYFGQEAIEQYTNDPMSGFFMRSPKAFLGIALIDAHQELFVKVVSLILSEIKLRSEKYLNSNFTGVVFGRPVNYMGSKSNSENQQALQIMRKAAQLAGFRDIHFVIEPMAASLVIARTIFDSNAPALVIDVGGGTTDIVLLNVNSQADEKLVVINAVGERVGGNDFDESLAKSKFAPFIGSTTQLRNGKALPNQFVMDALSTRDIHKQAKFRKSGLEIYEYISKTNEPTPLERLYQVYLMQLQHQILLTAEDVKKKLGEVDKYETEFPFFKNAFGVEIIKGDLPLTYNNELKAIIRNINNVLDGHLTEGQTFRIFLTGGMSKCPTLIEAIKEIIPIGVVINRISALQTVAAGIAVVAKQLSLSDNAHLDNFSVRGIPVTR